jgi:hypothetical protein
VAKHEDVIHYLDLAQSERLFALRATDPKIAEIHSDLAEAFSITARRLARRSSLRERLAFTIEAVRD